MNERDLRSELRAATGEIRRLQRELDAVWDDKEQRAEVFAQLQAVTARHEAAAHELMSIISPNVSSDADRAASLVTDKRTLRSNGPLSGPSPAGHAPHDRDRDGASGVAHGTCQAIRKKDGEPCSWPASKSGKYAGRFCRLHATEAGRAEKHRIVKVSFNPTGDEDDQAGEPGLGWTCPECGGIEGSFVEPPARHRADIVPIHHPMNLRRCWRCHRDTYHWVGMNANTGSFGGRLVYVCKDEAACGSRSRPA